MLNARAVQALKMIALLASSHPSEAVNSKQLSQQLRLSTSYIESLLKNLKKNELVMANRGPGGGYFLQKSVDEISVWDVVGCFEEEEEQSVGIRTQEHSVSQQICLEFSQIKQHFLQNYPLADITKHSPQIEKKATAPRLSIHFKPLEIRLAPKAPNSVFDLPNFMNALAA
jgi:hypothetical protein